MRPASPVCPAAVLLLALCAGPGQASSGGSMSSGPISMPVQRSPAELAKSAYNAGVRTIDKAKDYEADAAKAASDDKKNRALEKSRKAYAKALTQFTEAVSNEPEMYAAWNFIGFANRHLGHYDASLAAYDRALSLNPAYSPAIEYRAEAYLGLNRLDDAKSAYLLLFRDTRALADELMTAMRRWVDERRKDAAGVDPATIDAFAAWLEERATIAQQTASLAVDPKAPAWK